MRVEVMINQMSERMLNENDRRLVDLLTERLPDLVMQSFPWVRFRVRVRPENENAEDDYQEAENDDAISVDENED